MNTPSPGGARKEIRLEGEPPTILWAVSVPYAGREGILMVVKKRAIELQLDNLLLIAPHPNLPTLYRARTCNLILNGQ
jgi:hypothetical protein